jgi:3-dehydroquinate synthase
METIVIDGDTGVSRILIGEHLANLPRYVPVARPVVITDVNVRKLYALDSMDAELITIGTDEGIKTLDTVRDIYAQLVSYGVDRSSFIVGIGGGIVCDIAGFVASTFLRGMRFGFVATTLLAQVDASVGGKNGVNFEGYKNMVGVFNQPEFVICDSELLKTLPQREICCGLAEIVKHAAIADADLFAYLERHYQDVLALDRQVIEKLVYGSVRIKSSVVCRDEKEKAERRILNFGHTFGHAIEKVSGIAHGEAVSMGMVIASALSVKRGLLTAAEEKRLIVLLNHLNLPTHCEYETKAVFDAIKKDKKREGNLIHFVLLNAIGQAIVSQITLKELKDALYG